MRRRELKLSKEKRTQQRVTKQTLKWKKKPDIKILKSNMKKVRVELKKKTPQ